MGKSFHSPSGNRTLVSRVTGGDTDHYTNEDLLKIAEILTDRLIAIDNFICWVLTKRLPSLIIGETKNDLGQEKQGAKFDSARGWVLSSS